MNIVTLMTNNNAMQTSVLNGNIRNNDMIPTVSNVSEKESGSSRKQRHSSFQKNQNVLYKKNGKKSKAIIRSVHFDDELVPYYTISLDGREKQTDSAHLEACSPSIPQEQQHHDTFYPVPRLDPSPYIVVGSKRSKRRKLNGPKTPSAYVVVGFKRRKLNARKKTVTFGYLQVRPIENFSMPLMRKELGLSQMISILGDHQPRPEDCSPSSIRHDTFFLLPRLEPSLYVVVHRKRRKLNPRQKRVTWGFLQYRQIEKLSSREKQVMRKELQEMVQKNWEEMREEEMKRNTPKRVVWDDNLQIKLIPRLSDEVMERQVLEERRQLPKSILLKHPRQRNTSKRVVWDENLQIKLIPRLSEDEKLMRRKELHEIVSRNHDTEEEDDLSLIHI